jgi:hypothetical protein
MADFAIADVDTAEPVLRCPAKSSVMKAVTFAGLGNAVPSAFNVQDGVYCNQNPLLKPFDHAWKQNKQKMFRLCTSGPGKTKMPKSQCTQAFTFNPLLHTICQARREDMCLKMTRVMDPRKRGDRGALTLVLSRVPNAKEMGKLRYERLLKPFQWHWTDGKRADTHLVCTAHGHPQDCVALGPKGRLVARRQGEQWLLRGIQFDGKGGGLKPQYEHSAATAAKVKMDKLKTPEEIKKRKVKAFWNMVAEDEATPATEEFDLNEEQAVLLQYNQAAAARRQEAATFGTDLESSEEEDLIEPHAKRTLQETEARTRRFHRLMDGVHEMVEEHADLIPRAHTAGMPTTFLQAGAQAVHQQFGAMHGAMGGIRENGASTAQKLSGVVTEFTETLKKKKLADGDIKAQAKKMLKDVKKEKRMVQKGERDLNHALGVDIEKKDSFVEERSAKAAKKALHAAETTYSDEKQAELTAGPGLNMGIYDFTETVNIIGSLPHTGVVESVDISSTSKHWLAKSTAEKLFAGNASHHAVFTGKINIPESGEWEFFLCPRNAIATLAIAGKFTKFGKRDHRPDVVKCKSSKYQYTKGWHSLRMTLEPFDRLSKEDIQKAALRSSSTHHPHPAPRLIPLLHPRNGKKSGRPTFTFPTSANASQTPPRCGA